MLPVINPVWFQYLSHKVGRLLVPWALVALAVSNAALAATGWMYTIALALQLAFDGMAAAGAWLEWSERRQATRLQRRPAFEDGALSLAGKDAR